MLSEKAPDFGAFSFIQLSRMLNIKAIQTYDNAIPVNSLCAICMHDKRRFKKDLNLV